MTPPEVTNTNWVSNPIDAFILSKLEARGIEPAPLAKRRAQMHEAITMDPRNLDYTTEVSQSVSQSAVFFPP